MEKNLNTKYPRIKPFWMFIMEFCKHFIYSNKAKVPIAKWSQNYSLVARSVTSSIPQFVVNTRFTCIFQNLGLEMTLLSTKSKSENPFNRYFLACFYYTGVSKLQFCPHKLVFKNFFYCVIFLLKSLL